MDPTADDNPPTDHHTIVLVGSLAKSAGYERAAFEVIVVAHHSALH